SRARTGRRRRCGRSARSRATSSSQVRAGRELDNDREWRAYREIRQGRRGRVRRSRGRALGRRDGGGAGGVGGGELESGGAGRPPRPGLTIAELYGHPFGVDPGGVRLTGNRYPLGEVRLLAPGARQRGPGGPGWGGGRGGGRGGGPRGAVTTRRMRGR